MRAVDIPGKFNIPFANAAGGGYIRAIPQASQIGITDGAASLTDGFPPLNFLAVGAGGIPPFGQDFNGLMKWVTQWAQWQSMGGPIPWDSSFSTAIGGYPQGAIVESATTQGKFWESTADNNLTNPDTGGANWITWPSAAALGGAKVPFNWVQISNTTRTLYSAVTGFTSAWSSGTFVKASSTSLLGLRMSTNVYDGGTGANMAVMRVTINGVNYEAITHVSDGAIASPAANAEFQIGFGSPLAAGSYPYSIKFGRYDGTVWTAIVNPTQAADAAYLPVATPTSVTFWEVEP